ncbi:MAG: DUF1937 family protein [Spirochaetota bacterium]
MQRRIYLASPYSHWCPLVRWWRWFKACRAAASLMAQGIHVYSPIAHSHWLTVLGRLPKGWDYWRIIDQREILNSKELWVLRLPGWNKSHGVRAEIKAAGYLKLPVRLVWPRQIRKDLSSIDPILEQKT